MFYTRRVIGGPLSAPCCSAGPCSRARQLSIRCDTETLIDTQNEKTILIMYGVPNISAARLQLCLTESSLSVRVEIHCCWRRGCKLYNCQIDSTMHARRATRYSHSKCQAPLSLERRPNLRYMAGLRTLAHHRPTIGGPITRHINTCSPHK